MADRWGYDKIGYDMDGYDKQGMNRQDREVGFTQGRCTHGHICTVYLLLRCVTPWQCKLIQAERGCLTATDTA